jgi:hypothetical protein
MLSEVLWTFFISSTIGCFVGMARMLYKSKCKTVTCCGLRIDRDVEGEEKLDEMVTMRNREESKV